MMPANQFEHLFTGMNDDVKRTLESYGLSQMPSITESGNTSDTTKFAQFEDLTSSADGKSQIPSIQTEEQRALMEQEVKEYKKTQQAKLKASLFDYVFANEQQAYFDEHKHIMTGKEKKRLKAILIKKIDKGDIYIDKVGKIKIRKGSNKK